MRRRLMIIGAHPDDCEYMGGGLAALCAAAGWSILLLSVTNGNAGHHEMTPRALAARRAEESRRAASRIGARHLTLGEPDGRLFVTERSTGKVVRSIRRFAPEIVVTHRTSEEHRDHRLTAQLVIDSACLLRVPLLYPSARPMEWTPVILHAFDASTEGPAFRPDLLCDITPVLDRRSRMLLDHESQFLEWIPWLGGNRAVGRRRPAMDVAAVIRDLEARPRQIARRFAKQLRRKYHRAVAAAEAFQVSEYGHRPRAGELARLIPF